MEKQNLSLRNQLHLELMQNILSNIQDKPIILKGGTALLLGYNLDRFSEDIDLDANKSFNLEKDIQKAFSKLPQFTLLNINLVKDTETTKRYKVHYDNELIASKRNKVLKIELSFREDKDFDLDKSEIRNGIRIYNIDELIEQKTFVSTKRQKIRDLYDVNFLMQNYIERFSVKQLERIRSLGSAENIESVFLESYNNDTLTSHISLEELCIMVEDKCTSKLEELKHKTIPQIIAIEAKNYHTDKMDYLVFDERKPNTAFVIGKDSFNPADAGTILDISDNENYTTPDNNGKSKFTSNVEILNSNSALPNDLIYVKNDYEGYEGLLPNKESLILFSVKDDFTRNKDTKNITITGTGKDTDIVKINVKNTKLEKFTADNSVVLFDTDSVVKVNKFTINNSMVLTDKDTVIRTNEFISNNAKVAHIGNDETNGKLEISANIIEINGIKGKDVDIDFIQWGTAAKKTEINKATTDGKIKFNIHNNSEINNSKGKEGTKFEFTGFDNFTKLNNVENITKLASTTGDHIIDMKGCQVESQQVIEEFEGKVNCDDNTKIGLANKSTDKAVTQAIVKSPELGQG